MWVGVGQLCVAPETYDGICSPAMDFESYSTEDKAQWSVMCGVAWCGFLPCALSIACWSSSSRSPGLVKAMGARMPPPDVTVVVQLCLPCQAGPFHMQICWCKRKLAHAAHGRHPRRYCMLLAVVAALRNCGLLGCCGFHSACEGVVRYSVRVDIGDACSSFCLHENIM